MAFFKEEIEKGRGPGPSANPLLSRNQSVQLPPGRGEDMPNQAASAASRGRTYLDQGTRVNGKLSFAAPVQIDGQIEGEIDAHDTSVMIGQSAAVTAKINAVSVTVAGVVNGDITASQRIELQPSAKVSGRIAAPKLVMHEGAMFEGNCTMSTKTVREDRKPGSSRKEERLVAEISGREHTEQA